MTNEDMVRGYLTWLSHAKRRRDVTVYNYTRTLELFLSWIGKTRLEKVRLTQLESFVRRERGGRAHGAAPSPATQAKDVAILRQLFSYLRDRGLLETDPTGLLVTPTVRNRNPKALPDQIWLQLWDSDLPLVERVAWGLGFFGGLRRAELCLLRPDHFAAGRIVSFPRKGGGDDVLDLAELCGLFEEKLPQLGAHGLSSALDKLCGLMGVGPLLGTNPDQLNRMLRKRCELLQMEHLTPHALRHSFVSNLLRAGVPIEIVAELANHSNVAITWRYAKVGGGRLREWRRGI